MGSSCSKGDRSSNRNSADDDDDLAQYIRRVPTHKQLQEWRENLIKKRQEQKREENVNRQNSLENRSKQKEEVEQEVSPVIVVPEITVHFTNVQQRNAEQTSSEQPSTTSHDHSSSAGNPLVPPAAGSQLQQNPANEGEPRDSEPGFFSPLALNDYEQKLKSLRNA